MEVMTMKTAAVSALKASLSEYLAGVKAGEEIIVTDRGKPIAKLMPLQPGEMDGAALNMRVPYFYAASNQFN
jgi:prevent-host-death family protein